MSNPETKKTSDIELGVLECRQTAGGILLDVRTKEEFEIGHIPGAVNLDLADIREASTLYGKEVPLFLYCRSGNRSGQAAVILERMGYTRVKNIGGIIDYHGEQE